MPIVLKDYRPLVISKMQIELNNKSRKDEISEKENRFEMMGQKIISPEGTKYQIAEDEILSDELGIGKNPEGMTYVTPLGLLIFFIISALGCPPHCGASTQSLLYVALSGLDLSGWKGIVLTSSLRKSGSKWRACHFEERNDEKSSIGLYGFLSRNSAGSKWRSSLLKIPLSRFIGSSPFQ